MGVGVSFGTQYAKTRFADVRISERLLGLLGLSPGSVVADIGAGTGNYSGRPHSDLSDYR
jgi:ubiquinone/menaquinone biosynthesis C-methylase UbiE